MKSLFAIVLTIGVIAALPATAQQAGPVVTFTIDDSTADQMAGARILSKYGLHGTFYVISGSVGTAAHLTRAQLDELKAAGHEIGGHTVSHPDLTKIAPDEARRQICADRATLTEWGHQVTSFAYPFTAYNPDVQRFAAECGYTSARSLGDLRGPRDCLDCSTAETIPPENPYDVRAPDLVTRDWTLADLQSLVLNASSGWVPIVLHQICDGCADLSLSPAIMDAFAAWLVARRVQVRTVHEVMGGPVRPVVAVPPAARTALVNPGLEDGPPDANGLPICWSTAGWGENKVTRTRTNDAHTGQWAQRLDVISHRNGDAKILPDFDLGTCAPSATPGRAYRVSAWFKSTGFTQFAVYRRLATGGWVYWTSSPPVGPSLEWSEARWMTPALPRDSTGLSFGVALISVGSLTTDDYGWTLTGSGPRARAS
ncbi:polysaccharide deacetylase family protein [Lentzea tibetensis]|uniref:Polysaccharide deacetylase family protein n=1 Tax=Lentzea tibetensis TaxID=2591470 RepID=A0A563EYG3_9PSEU|nr:polysaccharide deacetylase family protein [Lentzea tibetensis]TWP52568.1 polysaccharide deacetylase family protein [Lentzea tibetensis]